MKLQRQQGFTLIEIAIVLVIIGLLLGGVLKGQELIASARVRNLITTQDGYKAAYFGFLDRYRALPGDYAAAAANIPGCNGGTPCVGGNNNGQITANGVSGATIDEQNNVWEHLSKAGFITGSFVYSAGAAATGNTPTNPFGSFIQIIFDGVYREAAADTGNPRHNLKTGANVSSEILAEMDRKIDDGLANAGQFRHSTFGGTTYANCAVAANTWQSQTPFANCGGVSIF